MAAFVKRDWKSYKFDWETQMAYGSLPHDMSAVASWARLGRDEGRNVTRSWNLTMVPALLKLLNGKCPFKRTASWGKTYQHDLIRKNGHRAIWTTWKITILKKGRGCDRCPHFIRFSTETIHVRKLCVHAECIGLVTNMTQTVLAPKRDEINHWKPSKTKNDQGVWCRSNTLRTGLALYTNMHVYTYVHGCILRTYIYMTCICMLCVRVS